MTTKKHGDYFTRDDIAEMAASETYDAIEIQRVHEYSYIVESTDQTATFNREAGTFWEVEVCTDKNDCELFHFYSVYLHIAEPGGVECVADLPNEAEALTLSTKLHDLTGKDVCNFA